jgi:methanogenic corrinoid protein MtbC1
MPLLIAIGDRWERGGLDVAAEHFGSAIVRRHLHAMVEAESRRNAGGRTLVCACAEGELHEGGLLAFAIHAAALGWCIVYLGANTPIADAIATADSANAVGLGLSLGSPKSQADKRAFAQIVEALARWKSRRGERRVWAGGRVAGRYQRELSDAGVEFLVDASDLGRGTASRS